MKRQAQQSTEHTDAQFEEYLTWQHMDSAELDRLIAETDQAHAEIKVQYEAIQAQYSALATRRMRLHLARDAQRWQTT